MPIAYARWRATERNEFAEALLQRELGIGKVLAAALAERGITDPAEAEAFLYPKLDHLHDPKLLPDYHLALKEILGARERKEMIFLHGDYDVDGMTSAAMLYRFLRVIGCEICVHVPHRMKEGYGIHASKIEDAHAMGAKLFLTCDCGASAIEQIGRARELGMNVVVTDHHHVGAQHPDANAFVNPHRADSKYPFANLCGAGVALKLCHGITEELGFPVERFYRAYLDLAALGTIADVMPLVGENRVIAKLGLRELSTTKKVGLQALFSVSQLSQAASRGFDAQHVSYQIAPRLNAAGRIDDAVVSLDLLLSETLEEALPLAQRLENFNQERKAEQERIIAEAIEQVEANNLETAPIIIVIGEGWHKGVIGIVAGRIRELYNRPAFVMARDPETGDISGSGRSIPGFNLARMIEDHPDLLDGGGHTKAAGMSVKAANVEEMREKLLDYAQEMIDPEDLEASSTYCTELGIGEVTLKDVDELSMLDPVGEGNWKPRFLVRNASCVEIKSTKNPEHVMLTVAHEGARPAVFKAFRFGGRLEGFSPGTSGDYLVELEANEFRGEREVQWTVKDLDIRG